MRLTLKIDCPVSKLPDEGYRSELIVNATKQAKELYADGVNIDIEQVIKQGSEEEEALTLFSKELTEAFHNEIPGSQVLPGVHVRIMYSDRNAMHSASSEQLYCNIIAMC